MWFLCLWRCLWERHLNHSSSHLRRAWVVLLKLPPASLPLLNTSAPTVGPLNPAWDLHSPHPPPVLRRQTGIELCGGISGSPAPRHQTAAFSASIATGVNFLFNLPLDTSVFMSILYILLVWCLWRTWTHTLMELHVIELWETSNYYSKLSDYILILKK